jgi:hypothetical protein
VKDCARPPSDSHGEEDVNLMFERLLMTFKVHLAAQAGRNAAAD